MLVNSGPLYIRFFGIGKVRLSAALSSFLSPKDVYFIQVDHYEVVLELVQSQSSLAQIKRLVLRHLGAYLIGYGRNRSVEQIVGRQLIRKHISITGAESLTAGLFQTLLGNVPGISAVFPGGFVTYSNHAKHQLLGIPDRVINNYGVVSKSVAEWMANQSRRIMNTDLAVSFTGAAGPASLEDQPAGTVWIGLALRNHRPVARLYHLMPLYRELSGFRTESELRRNSRNAIRLMSAKTGFKIINDRLNK